MPATPLRGGLTQALDGEIVTTSILFAVFSFLCAMVAVTTWLKERRASTWPTTVAKVVETPPQTMFEGSRSVMSFNQDSDHFLEWIISGNAYRALLEDRGVIVMAGFKLWRKTPSTASRRIRYDPARPSKYYLESKFGSWKILVVVALATLLVAVAARF